MGLFKFLWLPRAPDIHRTTFTSLNEVTRSTILEAPVEEIIMMLEQNILAKFKLTPKMKQREERKLVELGG